MIQNRPSIESIFKTPHLNYNADSGMRFIGIAQQMGCLEASMLNVSFSEDALAHIRDKGGRAALDLICMST